jgi:hypothetical protein
MCPMWLYELVTTLYGVFVTMSTIVLINALVVGDR